MPIAKSRAATVLGLAALAAASAVVVREAARRAERRHPPMGDFVEVDGVRLHYVAEGDGPPLVLLHGNGSMIQDFASSALVREAALRWRVIVFDRPGYGYSTRPRGRRFTPKAQADLFVKAFAALGLHRPIVLGHSYGALVAAAIGVRHPEAIKALVLASGYYFPSVRPEAPVFGLAAVPVLGDVLRHTVSPVLTRLIWPGLMRVIFGPKPEPESFRRGFPKSLALRPGPLRASAAEALDMIPAAAGLSRDYGHIAVPTVVIAGADDRMVDTAYQSGALHRAIPGSRLVVLPGFGHMVHHGASSAVAAAVLEAERLAAA
ncbi:alpha/beta fold hydrolase [Chthonobacter rhizosphaerae]|uniref:alpha/beta fold hydrolase n=1 Tax=Chthonobacter rhizosphaerae TaxID=2735553 RepID=UPI0015EE60DF|nr:alpha/beta hydrolase [Chthonobacter rhizosphaerae]